MKTGEWNETFNFDEELSSDLTTAYETTENILESLSVAGKEIGWRENKICLSVFLKK